MSIVDPTAFAWKDLQTSLCNSTRALINYHPYLLYKVYPTARDHQPKIRLWRCGNFLARLLLAFDLRRVRLYYCSRILFDQQVQSIIFPFCELRVQGPVLVRRPGSKGSEYDVG